MSSGFNQNTTVHRPPDRLALGVFLLALLFAALLGLYAYWSAGRQILANSEVARTQRVLDAMAALRAALSDSEAALLPLLGDSDHRGIDQFLGVLERIPGNYERVGTLALDDPGRHARVKSLAATLATLTTLHDAILAARRSGEIGAARQALEGNATMQKIVQATTQLNVVEEHERIFLTERISAQAIALEHFRRSVIGLSIVMGGIFAGLYAMLQRRLLAERAWRLTEKRFHLMAENAHEYGVIMLDAKGNISTWNPGAERITGFRQDETIGRHFSCLYRAEDVEKGKPALELQMTARDGQVHDEGWRIRKDGTCFWADVVMTALYGPSGELYGYAKLTCDATGHRQLEERLRNQAESRARMAAELDVLNKSLEQKVEKATSELKSAHDSLEREVIERRALQALLIKNEARFRGILDHAMDAIITVDETQRILLFNLAAARVFGCSKEEALGGYLDRFIPERFRSAHADHIHRFGLSPDPSRHLGGHRPVIGLRANGEEFPIEASISKTEEGDKSFFTAILRDVTENARDREALRQASERMRELVLLASQAREQERRRVARELHDEVAQDLSVLNIDMEHVKQDVKGSGELGLKLERMQRSVMRAITSTRRIAADLRPSVLDDLGLVPAVEWLATNFTQRTGVLCEILIDPPDMNIEEPHATAVFRILQEALSNTAKHAHSSKVTATIQLHDGCIVLDIRDNGRGFRLDDPPRPDSMGVAGLRERAQLLGGQAFVDSSPGNGTHVHATIPYLSKFVM